MRKGWGFALTALAVSALSAGVPEYLHATRTMVPSAPKLGTIVPTRFGAWAAVPTEMQPVAPFPETLIGDGSVQYSQIVSRTYQGPGGALVMLMLAYKGEMEQENKVHRPEICYVAQGYVLLNGTSRMLVGAARPVPVRTFLAQGAFSAEEVAYWVRSGNDVAVDGWGLRLSILKAAVRNRVPDGILVRASVRVPASASPDEKAEALKQAQAFLIDLTNAMAPDDRRWLLPPGHAAGAAT